MEVLVKLIGGSVVFLIMVPVLLLYLFGIALSVLLEMLSLNPKGGHAR